MLVKYSYFRYFFYTTVVFFDCLQKRFSPAAFQDIFSPKQVIPYRVLIWQLDPNFAVPLLLVSIETMILHKRLQDKFSTLSLWLSLLRHVISYIHITWAAYRTNFVHLRIIIN